MNYVQFQSSKTFFNDIVLFYLSNHASQFTYKRTPVMSMVPDLTPSQSSIQGPGTFIEVSDDNIGDAYFLQDNSNVFFNNHLIN